jgi:hypothetical protein
MMVLSIATVEEVSRSHARIISMEQRKLLDAVSIHEHVGNANRIDCLLTDVIEARQNNMTRRSQQIL